MSMVQLPSSTTASTTETSPILSPTSNHDQFHGPDDYASDVDYDDEDTLPYPAPLPRSAFLEPDFSAQEYLSSLRNRHQALEDLRSDLRSRVQDLSKELFDLVNNEYEDFLSVGSTLKGGEDRIEQVRLGTLGFRKEVESINEAIRSKGCEVRSQLEQRRYLRRDIALGRRLLNLEDKLQELEGQLHITNNQSVGSGDDGMESEDDEDFGEGDPWTRPLRRLQSQAQMLLQYRGLAKCIGKHPFIDTHNQRLLKVHDTLLLDLGAQLRQAKSSSQDKQRIAALQILDIYRLIDEQSTALQIVKR